MFQRFLEKSMKNDKTESVRELSRKPRGDRKEESTDSPEILDRGEGFQTSLASLQG